MIHFLRKEILCIIKLQFTHILSARESFIPRSLLERALEQDSYLLFPETCCSFVAFTIAHIKLIKQTPISTGIGGSKFLC